jgi:hypothetical protein
MITDPILKEKWKVQKKISNKSNYDMNILVEEMHKNIGKIKKEFKINFKYSDKKGGYLENTSYPLMVSDK